MLTALIAILFWILCLPMLYVLGEMVGARLSKGDKIIDGVFLIALGWASFAYFLVVIGLFHHLSIWPTVIFMLTVLFLRRKKLNDFTEWAKTVVSFFDIRSGVGTWEWFVRIGLLFSIILTFIFCMLPESSNDGLAYQLNLPKLFLQQSSIVPIEYELRSYRSFLQNVLYAVGLMFGNVPMGRLFHWITGVLLVLAVTRVVEQKTNHRELGFFAGALLWFTPTLINQITTTYVDVGVTLFVFLSVYLLIEEPQGRKINFFYSGLLMGIAISIKYLAATAAVAAFLCLLGQTVKNRFSKEQCSRLIVWGVAVLIACWFWFIRNWILTGNPVYPHFATLFNKDAAMETSFSYYEIQGLPRTWINYLLIPWNLTFIPVEFDYHHWIGPAYLLLLPFVVYGAIKSRKNLPYLFFMWLMTTVWFLTAQTSRYLMPMFPFYLICAALGISFIQHQTHKKMVHWLIKSGQIILFVFLFVLSIYHFRIQFLPILRIWSADQYLTYTERTTGISRWMNQNLPSDAKVLMRAEVRYFYFDRAVIFEEFFSLVSKYDENRTPAEMAAFLKEKGFTYLLDGISLQPGATTRRTGFDQVIEDPSLVRKVITMISKNGREPKFIYHVYKLI